MPDADLVHRLLWAAGPRWFEGLAASLARSRWRAVAGATGLDRATYGTSRHLGGDPSLPRPVLAEIGLPRAFRETAPVVVERLVGPAFQRYQDLGLDFHADPAADAERFTARLGEAFARIAQVPSLAAAVGRLLAVLHVVRPEGPDYDVSYSDPLLPFSIFVGIGGSDQPNGDLRLAEGIVHECMHLQLTLVEETVPMVAGSDGRHHSPWQGTMRPVQGILHGLYVFRVIQDFFEALIREGRPPTDERDYLLRRLATIRKEAEAVNSVARSNELTPAGKRLVGTLLAS